MSTAATDGQKKIILFTGGDINNGDKGIVPASVGVLLKANGYNVMIIKMEPCINLDSTAVCPSKYAEKYILTDAEIASINFGHYERILNQKFTRLNNLTRGKMNEAVKPPPQTYNNDIVRPRNIVDATTQWIEKMFHEPIDDDGTLPDICIIELCGNGKKNYISDKKFGKALYHLKEKYPFLHIHVSKMIDEKVDFVKKSVQSLRGRGWKPDMLICRNQNSLTDFYTKHTLPLLITETDKVINFPEAAKIRSIPILLYEQNAYDFIASKLHLKHISNFEEKMDVLKQTIEKADSYTTIVRIAIIGKFWHPLTNEIYLECYESMVEQLYTAAADERCQCKVEIIYILAQNLGDELINDKLCQPSDDKREAAWNALYNADGILIPAAYGPSGMTGMLKVCKYARKNMIPLFSFGLGFQLVLVDFARNVLGINAGDHYRKVMDSILFENPEKGGIRYGLRTIKILTEDSMLYDLYGKKDSFKDRFANNFEVNPLIIPRFVDAGIRFTGVGFDENGYGEFLSSSDGIRAIAQTIGKDKEEEYKNMIQKLCECSLETGASLRMQALELKDHPYYVASLYHPKCGDPTPASSSPPFVGLVQAALRYKEKRHS